MGNNTSTSNSSSTRKSTAASRAVSGNSKSLNSNHDHPDFLKDEFGGNILHEVSQQQQLKQHEQQEHHQFQQQQFQQHSPFQPQHQQGRSALIPINSNASGSNNQSNSNYNQFTNDLIEDEYNELNDGLIETDSTDVARNIIPNNDSNHNSSSGSGSGSGSSDDDNMEIDHVNHNISNFSQSNSAFSSNDNNNNINNVNYNVYLQSQSKNQSPDYNNEFSDNDNNTPTPDLSKVDFTKITAPPTSIAGSYVAERFPQQQQQQQHNHNHNHNHHHNHNQQQADYNSYSGNGSYKGGKKTISVEIKWVNTTKEDIQKISIIGSFSNWRDVIKLSPSPKHKNEYVTTIKLPLGVHKLLYIINNEYRVSEQLPTATDQEGIFFNWFEVLDHTHLFNHSHNQQNHVGALTDYDANIIQVAGRHDVDYINQKSNNFLAKVSKETPDFEHIENPIDQEMNDDNNEFGTNDNNENNANNNNNNNDLTKMESEDSNKGPKKYVSYNENLSTSFLNTYDFNPTLTYSSEIPEMFMNYDYFKTKGADYELTEPPQLPAHLNNVLLNKISNNQNQQHAANIPQLNSPNNIANHIPNNSFIQNQSSNPNQNPFQNQNHNSSDSFKPPNPSYNSNDGLSKRPALRRADSSYYASNKEAYHLSIPNHVILNHLMTTSIRNDVLTVACITRYSGKFVTQIMHSPADT